VATLGGDHAWRKAAAAAAATAAAAAAAAAAPAAPPAAAAAATAASAAAAADGAHKQPVAAAASAAAAEIVGVPQCIVAVTAAVPVTAAAAAAEIVGVTQCYIYSCGAGWIPDCAISCGVEQTLVAVPCVARCVFCSAAEFMRFLVFSWVDECHCRTRYLHEVAHRSS
jgi:hypothetical protein